MPALANHQLHPREIYFFSVYASGILYEKTTNPQGKTIKTPQMFKGRFNGLNGWWLNQSVPLNWSARHQLSNTPKKKIRPKCFLHAKPYKANTKLSDGSNIHDTYCFLFFLLVSWMAAMAVWAAPASSLLILTELMASYEAFKLAVLRPCCIYNPKKYLATNILRDFSISKRDVTINIQLFNK